MQQAPHWAWSLLTLCPSPRACTAILSFKKKSQIFAWFSYLENALQLLSKTFCKNWNRSVVSKKKNAVGKKAIKDVLSCKKMTKILTSKEKLIFLGLQVYLTHKKNLWILLNNKNAYVIVWILIIHLCIGVEKPGNSKL